MVAQYVKGTNMKKFQNQYICVIAGHLSGKWYHGEVIPLLIGGPFGDSAESLQHHPQPRKAEQSETAMAGAKASEDRGNMGIE